MTSLADLRPLQSGTIADCLGEDSLAQRLMDLGFVPGVEVRMIRSAPLGDPLEFHVLGARYALRKSEARRVLVEVA